MMMIMKVLIAMIDDMIMKMLIAMIDDDGDDDDNEGADCNDR